MPSRLLISSFSRHRIPSIVITLTFTVALAFGPSLVAPAWAQAASGSAPRGEVGGQYTALALDYPDQTRHGLGGWASFAFTDWLAVDGNISAFPSENDVGGRQWQGVAGIKSGWRNDRFGIFGKARPGVLYFTDRMFAPGVACPLIFPPPESCFTNKANFALDVGGAFELYPSSSLVVRVDVGDTMVRFGRTDLDPEWTHNLQVNVGAGWRF